MLATMINDSTEEVCRFPITSNSSIHAAQFKYQMTQDGSLAVEAFRQCRNICREKFTATKSPLLSALLNFCEQRHTLVTELHRVEALQSTVVEIDPSGTVVPLYRVSDGCSGVLSLMCTRSASSSRSHGFPVVEALIGQLEHDINALVVQLQGTIEAYKTALVRLRKAAEMTWSSDTMTVAQLHDMHALRQMISVASGIYSWMSQVMQQLRTQSPAVGVATSGFSLIVSDLSWWPCEPWTVVDGDQAWDAATRSLLGDVALAMIAADE